MTRRTSRDNGLCFTFVLLICELNLHYCLYQVVPVDVFTVGSPVRRSGATGQVGCRCGRRSVTDDFILRRPYDSRTYDWTARGTTTRVAAAATGDD